MQNCEGQYPNTICVKTDEQLPFDTPHDILNEIKYINCTRTWRVNPVKYRRMKYVEVYNKEQTARLIARIDHRYDNIIQMLSVEGHLINRAFIHFKRNNDVIREEVNEWIWKQNHQNPVKYRYRDELTIPIGVKMNNH
jgi:hypothetical protein